MKRRDFVKTLPVAALLPAAASPKAQGAEANTAQKGFRAVPRGTPGRAGRGFRRETEGAGAGGF